MLDVTQGKVTLNECYSKDKVRILFAGDLCMRQKVEELILEGKTKEFFQDITEVLHNKDLSIVNLENPLTNRDTAIYKSGPSIKADPHCVELILDGKFDVTTLANNHIGDYGPEAVLETIDILQKNSVKPVGAGKNVTEARKPIFVERSGIKMGILSIAENEFGIAQENFPGAAPLDPLVNIGEIKEMSAQCDISLVLVHAGNEYNPIPSPRMRKTYRSFVDAGASAVIGTHPHCPQGIEKYNDSVIVYSLGNFLMYGSGLGKYPLDSFWWKSYMVQITFDNEKPLEIGIYPYTFAPDASKVKLLSGENKSNFLKYLNYLSSVIKNEKEAELYWYAWCAIKGPDWLNYIKDINISETSEENTSNGKLLTARNAFSCEAHNEVLTTYLKMVTENKVNAVADYIDKIKKLQSGDINLECDTI
jgi:poly-gamma-glutamate synthesis protein (capsule biosynthesis protein)